jgi:hypothetical protein
MEAVGVRTISNEIAPAPVMVKSTAMPVFPPRSTPVPPAKCRLVNAGPLGGLKTGKSKSFGPPRVCLSVSNVDPTGAPTRSKSKAVQCRAVEFVMLRVPLKKMGGEASRL